MKIDVTWEEKDIVFGTRYGRIGLNEEWLIGYMGCSEGPARYVSISTADGMVTEAITKAAFAARLTENKYIPINLLKKLDRDNKE